MDTGCAFYAASMLLAALFPSFRRDLMEAPSRNEGSPMLRAFKRRWPADYRARLGKWFVGEGLSFDSARALLNTIASDVGHGGSGLFRCGDVVLGRRRTSEGRFNVDGLVELIERGRPFMIKGAEGTEYEEHAVLVVGASRDKDSTEFAILDPGRPPDPEWRPLDRFITAKGGAYVLYPTRLGDGPPLDKLVGVDDGVYVERASRVRSGVPQYRRWPVAVR